VVTIPYGFAANTKAQSVQVNTNFNTVAAAIKPTFVFTIPGTLITGTNIPPALISQSSWTISTVYAYVKTAPTGAALIIDINKNGTSIWNTNQANRITIGAGSQSASGTVFDTTSLAENDILSLDIDQVGSTVSSSDLTVELLVT